MIHLPTIKQLQYLVALRQHGHFMPHLFQGMPDLPESKVSITRAAAFIKARTPDVMMRRAAQ